jgi:predicted aspartyl protease
MSSTSIPEKVREVGKVVASLTISNRIDQARAAAGDIPADQIRTVTLDSVIVDTGATLLALPADVIARLGLVLRREVPIVTATGRGTARLYQDAALAISGREGTFDCLELPTGTHALLGVVPMEALGLEPDLRNQRLRLLPEEPGDTYFTLYTLP